MKNNKKTEKRKKKIPASFECISMFVKDDVGLLIGTPFAFSRLMETVPCFVSIHEK